MDTSLAGSSAAILRIPFQRTGRSCTWLKIYEGGKKLMFMT